MDMHSDDEVLNKCLTKILELATLALYGVNVQYAVHIAINDIYRDLAMGNKISYKADLLKLKIHLTVLADRIKCNTSDYKKTLEYAASLIAIDIIIPPIDPNNFM